MGRQARPRLDWRTGLVYTHRWLGIGGCLLFLAWFLSGIVLMYARMPVLTEEERLARAAPLDLSDLRVPAADAAATAGIEPDRLRIGMVDGRPVYWFFSGRTPTAVFADTGARLDGLTERDALALARGFMPEHAATIRYDRHLTDPDQWTLYSRHFLPMHRIALGDAAGTYVYFSDRSGDPVMKTTRPQRVWAYLGAVPHWLYFTPLRQHTGTWRALVIGLSLAGCVMCLSGLAWGLWRFSAGSRYRLKGVRSRTPYAGWMRWHHYAGLAFGVVTFSWILSGLFSMAPWGWSPSTAPTAGQRRAVAGGPLRLDLLTPARLRAAVSVMDGIAPKEADVLQFGGEPVLLGQQAGDTVHRDRWDAAWFHVTAPPPHVLVSVTHPARGAFTRFDEGAVEAAAREAMPDAPVLDAAWLEEYDAYYYDRHGARALPVLRVQFADPQQTWLYVDPARGAIALKHERLSRAERWLYQGLHSLDFPFLYYKRPLWDILVIVLSLGGIGLSVTALRPGWRRLRRHGRRLAAPARDAPPVAPSQAAAAMSAVKSVQLKPDTTG